jgi:glutathione synthase/RimK-type ligase-like ATP-grasp enzyme
VQFIVVGNPGHRRVTMFDAALAAQGLPPAHVVAWADVAARGPQAFAGAPDAAILRIDSAGEDDAVERALVRRGEAAARAEGAPAITAGELAQVPVELGRIIHPRQAHLGFLAALDDVAAAIRPGWRVVQPVAAIRDLFDKRVTSAQWAARGISIPEPLLGVRGPDDLRARMRDTGWRSVFVKIASSSSAAGLAIFTHTGDGEHAITTVEDTGRARYNTRKLQRVTARRALDRLLGFLLGEGAQVERAVPKARIGARYIDLRVLVIDGVPAFTVVRTSPHPITNLHLGGQRGDLDDLRARIAPADWERAMATCAEVQRASGAFHVGVDLMFEPDLATHRVIEGNAFGDLLPNLQRDGLDTYGWQIARLRGTV